jgi:hypothetical protein
VRQKGHYRGIVHLEHTVDEDPGQQRLSVALEGAVVEGDHPAKPSRIDSGIGLSLSLAVAPRRFAKSHDLGDARAIRARCIRLAVRMKESRILDRSYPRAFAVKKLRTARRSLLNGIPHFPLPRQEYPAS